MAKLDNSKVFKKSIQSVKAFSKLMSVSATAIYYAIKTDKVDYVEIEGVVFIVDTAFTRQYTPNKYPDKKKAKKRKK